MEFQPSLIVALISVAVAIGIGSVLLYQRRRHQQHLSVLTLKIAALARGSDRHVFVWHPKSDALLECTPDAGVPPLSPPTIQGILNRVPPENRDELEHHLASLGHDRQSFSLRQRLPDPPQGGTWLRITGTELPHTHGYCVITLENISMDVELENNIKTLTKERAFFQQWIERHPYPLWHRDAQGHLAYVNAAYALFVGKTRDTIVRDGIELHTPNENTDSHVLTSRRPVVVSGQRRVIACEEYTQPLETGLEGRFGFAHDVTAEEESQGALERHIKGQNDVLEFLSTGIAIYGADMRLQYFNNAYALQVGSLGSWLNTHPTLAEVLDALHERRLIPEFADYAAYKKKQLDMFTSLMSPTQELLHLPDDRTLRMVSAPHPLGGLVFMFEDVTDALTLERQYNTLIAVQKATLDHLHEGVAVFSSDNKLKLSNPAFNRIWNLTEADVAPGTPLPRLLDQTKDLFFEGTQWNRIRDRIIENVTNRLTKTGKIKRRDHTTLEFSYVPLPDGANMLSYLDITDRYRVEAALRERAEALEEADRLKSEFIANVSYELRAPLNTVIGFTEILMNQYFGELNHRQTEYAHGILESSKQLLTLINGILDLASMEAGRMILKREIINIPYLLRTVFQLLEKKARDHGHELTCMCSPAVDNMIGDERQLKQVIFNLVVNAIKFTPEGGKIHINADIEPDQVLRLYVEDNGLGIPEEDHERIFGKFERIEHFPNVGAGLGLALVKSFVELHRGRVEIRSAPNQGTRVTCYIPLHTMTVSDAPLSLGSEPQNAVAEDSSPSLYLASTPTTALRDTLPSGGDIEDILDGITEPEDLLAEDPSSSNTQNG